MRDAIHFKKILHCIAREVFVTGHYLSARTASVFAVLKNQLRSWR
jgi:hypothetical protein